MLDLLVLLGVLPSLDRQAVRFEHVDATQFIAMAQRHPVQRGQCRLRRKRRLAAHMVARRSGQGLWITRRCPGQRRRVIEALE